MALIEKLTNIADAIREKTGGTEKLSLDGMAEAIAGISAGGGDEQSILDSLIDGSITEVTSNVTKVGSNKFAYCYKLTSANFPFADTVLEAAFNNCQELTSVNFPVLRQLHQNAFTSCKKLESIILPKLRSSSNNALAFCYKLAKADFPVLTNIDTYLFRYDGSLVAVILRSNTLCTLSNKNAFNDCYHIHGEVDSTYNPEGLKDGYIYVPAALIENYRAATNWSTFATQFRALEDYTVDGTTTGALDESKI